MIDLRTDARSHMKRLVTEGGSGWHAYALDAAEQLVKADPIAHGGLVAAVEGEIGPEATKAARRALASFAKNGARA
jgi:hypothetical protein